MPSQATIYGQGVKMKAYASKIWKNPLFSLFMQGVLAYMVMVVMIIGTLQIPPDAILDSSLRDIISIFED